MTELRIDPFPPADAFARLWEAAWGGPPGGDIAAVLRRSLGHLCAYDDSGALVGFVNVATDGGVHAFLLDPTVHPDHRREGLGTRLVKEAARLAGERGAEWLHVDYEPHLEGFYAGCGFRPTRAGIMRLSSSHEALAPPCS